MVTAENGTSWDTFRTEIELMVVTGKFLDLKPGGTVLLAYLILVTNRLGELTPSESIPTIDSIPLREIIRLTECASMDVLNRSAFRINGSPKHIS